MSEQKQETLGDTLDKAGSSMDESRTVNPLPAGQAGSNPALPAKAEKPPIIAGAEIKGIVPTTYEDAFRLAVCFFTAGMAPESYLVKRDSSGKEVKVWEAGTIDEVATKARIALGIMKGLEIGIAPVSAIGTIMIVNNRPCLWGDGAVALVQRSGKMQWMRDWTEGEYGKDDFVAHCTVQRIDNEIPVHRTFGFKDAKATGLSGKKGPWSSGYGPRMCFNRARAWAMRDAFSDVLMGIGIVEEVQDTLVEEKRRHITNTSDLDDVTTGVINEPSTATPASTEPDGQSAERIAATESESQGVADKG